MLHVSRLAAKLEIIPLLDGKISIANAQLFGTEAYLYQRSAQEKPNFQFIIDTFKSDNTESKPVNLRIGNLVLGDRRQVGQAMDAAQGNRHLRPVAHTSSGHCNDCKAESPEDRLREPVVKALIFQ